MEQWVKVFNDYEVSNLGRMKLKNGKIINGHNHNKGYKLFTFCIDGKIKRYLAHRIVYETFNNCEVIWPMTINHINKVRDDNRLENLEVLSIADNVRYGLCGKKRKPFSDEWIKNIGLAHRGMKPMLGKKHSEETKEKIKQKTKIRKRNKKGQFIC